MLNKMFQDDIYRLVLKQVKINFVERDPFGHKHPLPV
jgi:hypothetical protein